MNNLILQKLLHGYQLVEQIDMNMDRVETVNPDEYQDMKLSNKIQSSYDPKWADTFQFAAHIVDGLNNLEGHTEHVRKTMKMTHDGKPRETVAINPMTMHHTMKSLSKTITQSGKFYLHENENNVLTEKEVKSLQGEVKFFAPYKDTFLQVENDDLIANILCLDTEQYTTPSKYKTSDDQVTLTFTMCIWFKNVKFFSLDLNSYTVTFSKNGDYVYEIEDTWFKDITDTEGDDDENFTNQTLNGWVHTIITFWYRFMIYLQFPQICDVKSKKGRSSEHWVDVPTKFRPSVLRDKPKFEHKELVINMFGDSSDSNGSGGGRSSGTAFHSVRKHLRRLNNGKLTWVKAHFRGLHSHGVITKDYKLEQ